MSDDLIVACILQQSDFFFLEHMFLIDRGVRPMCMLSIFHGDDDTMGEVYTKLCSMLDMYEYPDHGTVIPFVSRREDGIVECGYAGSEWAIDLFKWSTNLPNPQRGRIHGLLLGYSTEAIRKFDESPDFVNMTEEGVKSSSEHILEKISTEHRNAIEYLAKN